MRLHLSERRRAVEDVVGIVVVQDEGLGAYGIQSRQILMNIDWIPIRLHAKRYLERKTRAFHFF